MYRLIDTHAHLEEIKGLEQALTEARAVNIIAIIAVGSDYEYESSPVDILRALRSAAELTGVSEAQIAAATTDNALRFFRLKD